MPILKQSRIFRIAVIIGNLEFQAICLLTHLKAMEARKLGIRAFIAPIAREICYPNIRGIVSFWK